MAPRKPRKPRKSKLDPYMDKVGAISDREVAELAGVSSENVRAFRKRRGIPARWRDEKKQAAATKAPKPKATAKRKPRRGKLTPFMDQIGTTPDARIAEMAGTSHANVRAFRLRHDIPAMWRGEGEPSPKKPAAPVPTTAKPGRKPRRGKLTPFLEELGILTDKVIAEKSGTTLQNVRVYRHRHGIPARWRGEGEPLPNEEAIQALHAGPAAVEEPAPAVEPSPGVKPVAAPVVEAAPVAAAVVEPVDDDLPPEADDVEAPPVHVLKAYKVKVTDGDDTTTFVVTGANIVEAAQNATVALAQRSTEGEVVELKFLAVMLGS